MAYSLRFDGSNDYVTLSSFVGGAFDDRLDTNQDWALEWKFKRSGVDSYVHRFFDYDGGSSDNIIFRPSDGLFRVTLIAGQLQWSVTGVNSTDPATFRIVKTGGTNEFELFVDYDDGAGFISKGVRTSSVQIYNFNWIGQVGGSGYINGDLYYVSYTTSNSGVNFYADPSASGGTGSTLPDTVGGNDGTLVNFPTDNSQWVFYSDATGVTADVVYTVSAPTFSASASATVPAPQADIAFSVSSPSVSASASATLPNPIANVNVIVSGPSVSVASTASLPQPASDIAFTVNTPSVVADASSTLPGYSATVSFNVSTPSVSVNASATLPNPSADVSYTVSTPAVNALASATLPNPVSDIAFSLSAPSVSVSAAATEPNFNANVAFTVNAPTVSISASATLPQPESTVSLTVSTPSVSVVAIVGGIAIIVDEETNINQRVLSNNINAPILSNNING